MSAPSNSDRYQPQERLETGLGGERWLAEDTSAGGTVVLAVLDTKRASVAQRDLFERSSRQLATVQHAGLERARDRGTTAAGHPFVAFERVEAPTLEERFGTTPALSVHELVRIAGSVLDALTVAHGAGLVHGDVHPGRVLLTGGGRAKLVGFGLNRAAERAESKTKGPLDPSLTYMSPAQARGGAPTPDCDLYAVAAILYRGVTGVPPRTGTNGSATRSALADGPYLPVRELRSELTPAVAQVIDKALAALPDERFPNAATMRKALTSALILAPAVARLAVRAAPGAIAAPLAKGAVAPETDESNTRSSAARGSSVHVRPSAPKTAKPSDRVTRTPADPGARSTRAPSWEEPDLTDELELDELEEAVNEAPARPAITARPVTTPPPSPETPQPAAAEPEKAASPGPGADGEPAEQASPAAVAAVAATGAPDASPEDMPAQGPVPSNAASATPAAEEPRAEEARPEEPRPTRRGALAGLALAAVVALFVYARREDPASPPAEEAPATLAPVDIAPAELPPETAAPPAEPPPSAPVAATTEAPPSEEPPVAEVVDAGPAPSTASEAPPPVVAIAEPERNDRRRATMRPSMASAPAPTATMTSSMGSTRTIARDPGF